MKKIILLFILFPSVFASCEKETAWDELPMEENSIMWYYNIVFPLNFAGYYYWKEYDCYDFLLGDNVYYVEAGSTGTVYDGANRIVVRMPAALLDETIDISKRNSALDRIGWIVEIEDRASIGWSIIEEYTEIPPLPRVTLDRGTIKASINGDEISLELDLRCSQGLMSGGIKAIYKGTAVALPETPYRRQLMS